MPRSRTQSRETPRPDPVEDSALLRLSKEERARLGMDSWEPSLLRQLLTAHNKLNEKNND